MLAHPTLDQLNTLGLYGLAKGFKELEHKPEARGLDHAEWLGLLLEYELTLRRQKQFETRARVAKLRHPASVEDVNYQTPRGLDRALFLKLAACDWIAERRNLLVTGASGLGKSWLACALGHKACRENMSVLYTRMPRLFADLAIAHGDARYARLLRSLARVKLLILDDWGPEALTADQARDLLEIVEDRYDKGSLIITSQVPVDRWHDLIGGPHARRRHPRPRHSQRLSYRSGRREPPQAAVIAMRSTGAPGPPRVTRGAARPWIRRAALRRHGERAPPALPTATRSVHVTNPTFFSICGGSNPSQLDQSGQAKHHHSDPRKQTPGGRHQIGTPAGFKSESVADFLLEYVADIIGIRTLLPFSLGNLYGRNAHISGPSRLKTGRLGLAFGLM